MARRSFGGTSADFLADTAGNVESGGTGTVWTAKTGGTQITDLQTTGGSPTTTVTAAASPEGLVEFLGPDDGTPVVWVDFGAGRVKLTASDGFQRGEGIFNVKDRDYGAKGDGTTDDTAAIQAAIDAAAAAGGGVVFLPPTATRYLISSALNISGDNVFFMGAHTRAATIRQSTANAKILNNTGDNNQFTDLKLEYASTPTSGAVALYSSGNNTRVERIFVNNAYYGMEFTVGTIQIVRCIEIRGYVSVGLNIHAVNDVFVSQFLISAGSTTNGALGGIRLSDRAEAIVISDGDVLSGVYALTTDASSYSMNTRPAYCNFTNVFFDSSTTGSLVQKIVETEFVGCWFSAGRSGAGSPGLTLGTTDSLTFTNCRFFNCGSHGCNVQSTALRTVFIGSKFESNSVTTGSGVSHGLNIAANTTDFVVTGCIARNGLYTGTQARGVLVNTGTSDRYSITNNLVTGNVTAGVTDNGSGVNKTVSGNY